MYSSFFETKQIKIDSNEDNIPIEFIDLTIKNNQHIDYHFNSVDGIIKKFEFKNKTNIIYGNPLFDNKINFYKINEILNSKNLDTETVSKINGEFLLLSFDYKKYNLTIINDRFASFPLFYASISRNFYCSTNYFNIIKLVKQNHNLNLKKSAIAEFLWFRKLHGESTYHKEINFLRSSSIFYYKDKITIKKFWKPNFTKNNNTLKQNAEIFYNKLSNAIKLKTLGIDKNKIGLFLSGGMDTRLILSTLIKQNIKPVCYTAGYSMQGEYKTTKILTSNENLEHIFINLPKDLYDIFWEKKLYLSSGFHVPFHNIFLGYRNSISNKVDLLLHGHGLDYLFQGMYLPTSNINLFGKKTFYSYFNDLNKHEDILNFYINNIKYRNWRLNLNDLSKDNIYIDDLFREDLNKILIEFDDFSNNNFDIWESFLIENISRHYSQTDIMGIHSNKISSKISNENELFNFYLTLTKEHRKDGKISKEALKLINPFMAKTKSANTNFKITATPTELNVFYLYMKIMRIFTSNKKYKLLESSDRTWPDHDLEIIFRKKLNKELHAMCKSERLLDAIDFFDKDKLLKYINKCLNQETNGGGQFLMSLLTLDKFFKKIDNI